MITLDNLQPNPFVAGYNNTFTGLNKDDIISMTRLLIDIATYSMDKGFEFLLDVDYVLPFSDETDEALYIGNVSCGSGFNECVTVPVKYILSGDEERIRAVVKRYKDVVYEYLKRTLYYMPIYE